VLWHATRTSADDL
jgi:hypothetical protein